MTNVDFICSTDGSGYWSTAVKAVRCLGLELTYLDEEKTFGELQVRFDQLTWDPAVDGLIYTDDQFESDLRRALQAMGFSKAAAADVSYSEQGMQGDDFVSCDVGGKFIGEFIALGHIEQPGIDELLNS